MPDFALEELLAGGPFGIKQGCDKEWYFHRSGTGTRRPPQIRTYDGLLLQQCTKCGVEFEMRSQEGHFVSPIGHVPYVVTEFETHEDGATRPVYTARGCRLVRWGTEDPPDLNSETPVP